jgi:predicted PurR-regulated permease PerM
MLERRAAITLSNVLLVVTVGLLLVLIWQLRWLVIILMVAVVMAATIAPIIDSAAKFNIPRWVAAIAVYLGLVGLFIGAALLIGPTVATQIHRLVTNFPVYIETLRSLIANFTANSNTEQPEFIRQLFDPQSLTNWAIRSSQQLLLRSYGITKDIIGGVLSAVLALLISGYMVADSENLVQGIVKLFPAPWDKRLEAQVTPVSLRMGRYIQGRILVSAILGVAITIGLSFLGMSEFALGLGVIAGFTDLIPFFGPILGAVPALIVAVSLGGWTFLWTLLLFVIIQNLETYVLDPLLVGSSVKIQPLYQLLAVLGGTQVLGIVGALIVPPWIAGASVLLENLYLIPKLEAEKPEIIAEFSPSDAVFKK